MKIARTSAIERMVGKTTESWTTVMAVFSTGEATVQFGDEEPTSQVVAASDARELAEFFDELAKELEKR